MIRTNNLNNNKNYKLQQVNKMQYTLYFVVLAVIFVFRLPEPAKDECLSKSGWHL